MAAFPKGGEASKNPAYTCCVENGLGLRELMAEKGFEVIVTADKDGPDSGDSLSMILRHTRL